jgi:hypothetical protein
MSQGSLPEKPLGKPLGFKNYGSIGHLPNSRLGPGDHKVPDGQARICLEQTRDARDWIWVTEKLDGSNVGVALKEGRILSLSRSGYEAASSPYELHQLFAYWVRQHEERFRACLQEGQRIVGEWLALAHGTIYKLPHEPFVVFDMLEAHRRLPYQEVLNNCRPGAFVHPRLLHAGAEAFPMSRLLEALKDSGHGAQDGPEGAVYRVERPVSKGGLQVDFLAKWVRPDKIDGCYLDTKEHPLRPTWLWRPTDTTEAL